MAGEQQPGEYAMRVASLSQEFMDRCKAEGFSPAQAADVAMTAWATIYAFNSTGKHDEAMMNSVLTMIREIRADIRKGTLQ